MFKLALSIAILSAGAAMAQTTTVTPRSNFLGGGYTINTPGQPTTTVTPRSNFLGGGYEINR
jgi:hypothetical protein